MRILVACEFSGTVRDAFARRGCDAWSCDLLPSETEGNHILGDCMEAIAIGWDKILMHPPCTALCLSGNASYGRGMPKHAERRKAIEWTAALWRHAKAHATSVMMENPKNVMSAFIGKKTQTIHPWQFGHPEMKETWLWLHNLPPLIPTNDVHDEMMKLPKKDRERLHYASPGVNRWKLRSTTFTGIAEAMADQWGAELFV